MHRILRSIKKKGRIAVTTMMKTWVAREAKSGEGDEVLGRRDADIAEDSVFKSLMLNYRRQMQDSCC